MSDSQVKFVDVTGQPAPGLNLWPSVVIAKEEIDAEVERLANLPPPINGRRRSLVVHPMADTGRGLAPGIQVSIDVLKPGEKTRPIRHNSSQVNFCIRGAGRSTVAGKDVVFSQYDVWNTPSMAVYQHFNDSGELQVRLTYSNAALLEKMNAHFVEDDPPANAAEHLEAEDRDDPSRISPFGTFPISEDGAYLMPYEKLINPDVLESKSLHWPWRVVKEHLDKLAALGSSYVGRRLYLLYNPVSGRTNGTTHSFFATMTIRPPNIVDRPHRHAAAAINYYFAGSGRSTVEGKIYRWKAGDLMLSAPGLAVHNHASNDQPVYELTIQDSPLNIAMDSLLWQESLKGPMTLLGSHQGFETNRVKAA
ncbi:MAG TPA: AraC family ligand binding domain-containing protein [Candidatus Binataceae bacterium]|nr:AraC family ligand binding domain-containing protein [Candidatus Binataceae bacterium]